MGFFPFTFWGVVSIRDRKKRRHYQARSVSLFSDWSRRWANVKLEVINPPKPGRNYLLACNHIGFLDIFIIASQRPTLFITSQDLRETPGLGQMAEIGGCLFVNRRNRSRIQEEIQSIRQTLQEGHDVVLFPEAMATPGDKIYPFKKSLMTAVAGTDVPILPVVINYRRIDGQPMSDRFRSAISWHGDQSLLAVAIQTFALTKIEASLEYLQPVLCQNENERREVAAQVQAQVEAKYVPIPFAHQ